MNQNTLKLGQKQRQRPCGRLVPIFGGESGLPRTELSINLATAAAERGDSVLIVDCNAANSFTHFGLTPKFTLEDALCGRAQVRDTKHIVTQSHLTLMSSGNTPLEDLLGALAALSLSHDWVFVIPKSGCTPAHVRLAAAADHSILAYDSASDRFMRAYWMLDAIRVRAPKCDPLMICSGAGEEAAESYDLFAGTVRDFLGAPPKLGAIIDRGTASPEHANHILSQLNEIEQAIIAA